MSSAVLASSAKRAATLGSEARELSASNCPRRISLICAAFLLMNGCPFYFAGQQPAGVTGGLGTIPDVLKSGLPQTARISALRSIKRFNLTALRYRFRLASRADN